LVGIVAVVILQLLFSYTPPFQTLFETAAIPLWVWPWLVPGGLVFLRRTNPRSQSTRRTTPIVRNISQLR